MDVESLRYAYLRRVIAPTLRLLGFRVTQRIALAVARGIYNLNTLGRRRAEWAVQAAGNLDAGPVVREMYEHTARFWAEALFVSKRLSGENWERYIAIENAAEFDSLARAKRGCLLTTAYHGNLAAGAIALGQIFKPLHILVDFYEQPTLRAWQNDLYRIPNIRVIERREAQCIPDLLRAGGAVMMIAGQSRPHGVAFPVRFLGQTIRCYPTLERLAIWCDVPVVAFTCTRTAQPFTFTLRCEEVIHPSVEARPGELTRQFMASLERAILRDPAQFLWLVAPIPQTFPASLHAGERTPAPSAA